MQAPFRRPEGHFILMTCIQCERYRLCERSVEISWGYLLSWFELLSRWPRYKFQFAALAEIHSVTFRWNRWMFNWWNERERYCLCERSEANFWGYLLSWLGLHLNKLLSLRLLSFCHCRKKKQKGLGLRIDSWKFLYLRRKNIPPDPPFKGGSLLFNISLFWC